MATAHDRRRRSHEPGLVGAVALTYVIVIAVFFGAGYIVGRLV